MKCPQCGQVGKGEVLESRESRDGLVIRRRRQCEHCGERFTTYERLEEKPLVVVKRDNSRQPFDRQKVMRGLRIACQKRNIAEERLEDLVNEVEQAIAERPESEIPSDRIGREVMRRLAQLDPVAFVRFASVYESFRDVQQFIDTINGIEQVAKSSPESLP